MGAFWREEVGEASQGAAGLLGTESNSAVGVGGRRISNLPRDHPIYSQPALSSAAHPIDSTVYLQRV